jgi:peptidoglycan/xylan/chitin deacetylase (PgdA/CDA1 family)
VNKELGVSIHSIPPKRWLAKKVARQAMGLATWPFNLSSSNKGLRILTYHRFAEEARSPFSVAAEPLERQMQWLASCGLQKASNAIPEVLLGKAHNGCIVTMDDGDPTVYDVAAPIFERYAIPYIIYAVPGRIGQNDHLTAQQLRSLTERGAEIGSHSMTHRSMAGLSSHELAKESVSSFAYPFGTLRDFNQTVADAMREAGYAFALTSQHGAVAKGQDAMMLPRIKIEGGDPDWLFRAACAGGLDAWRLIDAGLSGLQKPEAKDLTSEKTVLASA